MTRSRGDMMLPKQLLLLLSAINFVAVCRAGPLGPLPNVTSAELGLKEGSCALGDVVYMPGDEFPGAGPCERCTCAGGGVQCERQRCEPRPGCKALHRPDHCCPTYQCECEQEGRVYGNGEKLVDPADPCRVCYCQGGEVVCRRIACFVRDDCTPRLVPGRCCPEYDNCPLRGVTSLPGVSSSLASVSTPGYVESPPPPPKENIKQEITIKEITPVSEIPVITDVKIKEILPSPSIEVAEYSSSKSPLIPREATSENNIKDESKTEAPSVIEVHPPSPVITSTPEATQFTATESKDIDASPSKISFSTQDSIHSSIYPSNVPIIATMGIPPRTAEPMPIVTTKAPIIEEDDSFDRNPAFPPLPDDLAVLRNHEDEIVPELVVDSEHVSSHDITVANVPSVTEAEIKEIMTITPKDLPDTTTITTTEKPKLNTEITTSQATTATSTEVLNSKENIMINLRSAIPTDILNSPSLVPEQNTDELDEATMFTDPATQAAITTTEVAPKVQEFVTDKIYSTGASSEIITLEPVFDTTTLKDPKSELEVSTMEQEQTTNSIAKSNIATEVTSQTELSSLPVETSDQNPPAVAENTTNDKEILSTLDSQDTSSKLPTTDVEMITEYSTASQSKENSGVEKDIFSTLDPLGSKLTPSSSEVITVSRSPTTESSGYENVETTEFIITSFASSETATDTVELIKISASPEKSAPIIESAEGKNNNYLTDLINLVRDVASISNHTEEPQTTQHVTSAPSISDSEELIPVNAGYKSKNKNFNQNSITEIPIKSKANKQKVVEIEDDEEIVTDSPPPYDKVEPTTRRPIIDNVSDDINIAENKTDKKDIEIITKSYVPTINHRRPTKVVMKKSNEKPASEESLSVASSAETSTDTSASNEALITTREPVPSNTDKIEEAAKSNSSTRASDSPEVTTTAPISTTEASKVSEIGEITTPAPANDSATTTSPNPTSLAQ